MTREEFIEKAHKVKEGLIDSQFDYELNKILDSGCIDWENAPNDYQLVWPAVAAFANKVSYSCIHTLTKDVKKRKKIAKNIECFI